jgi:uncharacterized membrane protein YfhO
LLINVKSLNDEPLKSLLSLCPLKTNKGKNRLGIGYWPPTMALGIIIVFFLIGLHLVLNLFPFLLSSK